MVKLNLPPFEYKVKKAEGKLWIFDLIRKKYVVLLPEEWVRQHFVHYLVHHLQYPKALIKLEGGLSFNQLQKRSDVVVFGRDGAPWMVVECKSPTVKLNANTVFQASLYNTTLRSRYIVVTNGLQHFCCAVDWADGKTTVLAAMPVFGEASGL